jgi:exodeoxyribonuclease-5
VTAVVRGSRERGVIIHKLFEEMLNGEIDDDAEAIVERARTLIPTLGRHDGVDPSQSLSAAEIGGCVTRTLALPEVAALRSTLMPEVPVYALVGVDGGEERAIVGIVDALSVDEHGTPQQIIDWKSDVEPTAQALAHYRSQRSAYLQATGVRTALLVFVTSGAVLPITS